METDDYTVDRDVITPGLADVCPGQREGIG